MLLKSGVPKSPQWSSSWRDTRAEARSSGTRGTISSASSIRMETETSSSMNQFDSELMAFLELGFYADNFADLTNVSLKAAGSTDRPLFYVLVWSIFRHLDIRWSERPLTETTSDR